MPREELPGRRGAISFELWHAGNRFSASAGFYADGRLAEIFVHHEKDSSPLDISTSEQAILVSIALQHGVPLDAIRSSLRREEGGAPAGPVLAVLDEVVRMKEARP